MVLIDDNSHVLRLGDALPPFRLPSVTGGAVSCPREGARITVIVFTCNHCPYAQREEDGLIELRRSFRDEDIDMVLVSSNDAAAYADDAPERMAQRAREKAYPFAYCYDESQQVAMAYGALCTPHCFVFDAGHRLVYKGAVRGLGQALVDLMAGRPVGAPQVNAIGCSIKWKPGNEPAIQRA